MDRRNQDCYTRGTASYTINFEVHIRTPLLIRTRETDTNAR